MDLSIIIVSYNVKYYLAQCLDSLHRALEGIDAEVCVVDNHSKDGSVDFIKKHYPWVKLIVSSHNNGFARGNNIAIRHTVSHHILLLNPDTIVGEDTLRQCLAFLNSHPNAGALGIRMLRSDGTNAPESRRGVPSPMTAFFKMCGLCSRYPQSRYFGRYYMGWLSWDEPVQIDIVSGAFMMVRRDVLKKIGLFDEDYFMYGEDIDLSYRILKAGFSNWYLPAQILHYKGESTRQSSFRHVHVFYQAMLIFLRKHYGNLAAWLSVPIKVGIYAKAAATFMFTTASRVGLSMRNRLLHRKSNFRYVFIGTATSIEKCRKITDEHGLNSTFYVADEASTPDGHLTLLDTDKIKRPTIVVYDISAFKYRTILNNFARSPYSFVHIGTFNPVGNIIITANNIIV